MSLNIHQKAVVRGVRWLGGTPRLVTFSIERIQVGAVRTIVCGTVSTLQ